MKNLDSADLACGPKGEVGHPALIAHTATFAPKLYNVTPGAACLVGHAIANVTAIRSRSGWIAVDTGSCLQEAESFLTEFGPMASGPLKGIVYTHCHYTCGAAAYAKRADTDALQIWGHERLEANRQELLGECWPAWGRRTAIFFGMTLPATGPDAMPNYGLGPFFLNPAGGPRTLGHLPVTHDFAQETDIEIDGVRLTLFPAPADTDDSIAIHVPAEDLVITNHVWPALINIYPLRGGPFRDPREILRGVDWVRKLRPQHLIGVHGRPLSGRQAIYDAVTDYRDALAFIYDQTVRGLNKGMGPDELVDFVRLPAHLANSHYTRQFCGEVPHFVRQIACGLFGWFDGDAGKLHPMNPRREAEKMTAALGGDAAVRTLIGRALADEDWPWAIRLSDYLLHLQPEDETARLGKATALRRQGQASVSAHTRAYMLTLARELEGASPVIPPARVPPDFVLLASIDTFIRTLATEIDVEKAKERTASVGFVFTDVPVRCGVAIRRGVVEFLEAFPEQPDCVLTLSRQTWAQFVGQQLSLREAHARGEVTVTPSLEAVEDLFSVFDRTRLVAAQ